MKKILMIGLIMITICISAGAVSAEGLFDLFGDKSDTKNTDDIFIVGFNGDYPPFGYKDENGNYTGFDIELAKEVCKRNNWTFKAQPIIDWNTKQMELDSNEIDCIWSEFTINGRENNYTWSEPYYNNTQVAAVKSDSNINGLADMKGKILDVQQGSSVLNTIRNNETLNTTFKEINEVDRYDTALMNLQAGICDVVILDNGMANYLAAKHDDIKLLNDPISVEQYGIGFKKGNTNLKDQVQKTLDDMFKDGTVEKIAQNYSDYKISEGLIFPK
ncbi:amino acid ABC transporter substrate-binding protein [Methanobrevibacter sp.]|uniref:amino acid ABC transporter substrate-binding protein n=1 Tax=Methanobrevibacter sp. TaxID=66852 RepID=UPI00389017A6